MPVVSKKLENLVVCIGMINIVPLELDMLCEIAVKLIE